VEKAVGQEVGSEGVVYLFGHVHKNLRQAVDSLFRVESLIRAMGT